MGRLKFDRQVLSWAMYDWANSAFATVVMAGFFPAFFSDFWYEGEDPTRSTFLLGVANSVSGLLVAVSAPVFGALADRGGWKRKFLLTLAFTGILGTASLYFIEQGAWLAALLVFVVSVYGFMSANTFYDALMVGVATDENKEVVSAAGYALGYLGGGVLLVIDVYMFQNPSAFGIADEATAVRIIFLTVAVWWLLFSIPMILWVKEPKVHRPVSGVEAVKGGLIQLAATVKELRSLKTVLIFLAAYWLYIDGVHTMVRMAVDYGKSLGFDTGMLITALVITQFVGFPATLVVGKLGARFGAKPLIYAGIGVYVLVTIWAYFMSKPSDFYYLAATIGLAQGGVQALSRSYFVTLIPKERAAQFFGFYNMLGKFAAVLGPMLVGVVAALTGSNRVSILSLLILFVAGAFVLRYVDAKKGREDLEAFQRNIEAIEDDRAKKAEG